MSMTAYIVTDDGTAMRMISGKPLIEWQLAWLSRHGAFRAVICGAGDAVKKYLSDGGHIGMQLQYHPGGKTLWGTFLSAAAAYPCSDFVLLRGSVLFTFDLSWFISYASALDAPCAALHFRPDVPGTVSLDTEYRISAVPAAEGYHDGGVYAGHVRMIAGAFDRSDADLPIRYGVPFGDKHIDLRDESGDGHTVSLEKRAAVFFDRDGILVEDTGYLAAIADVRLIDASIPVIRRANELGRTVIVLTNQAGVAKGKFTEESVRVLNSFIGKEFERRGVRIDDWYYCSTHPAGTVAEHRRESLMRKPGPGMLLTACREHDINAVGAMMVGDKDSDALAVPYVQTHLIPGRYPITRAALISSWGAVLAALA